MASGIDCCPFLCLVGWGPPEAKWFSKKRDGTEKALTALIACRSSGNLSSTLVVAVVRPSSSCVGGRPRGSADGCSVGGRWRRRNRKEAEADAGTHPQLPYVDLHGSSRGGAGRDGVSGGRRMLAVERRRKNGVGMCPGGGMVDGGWPGGSWLRLPVWG